MKLTIFLIFSGLMTVSASIYSQATKLTLDLNGVAILDVFKQIESQSEFVFIYKNEVIDLDKKVNVKVDKSTIDVILEEIFRGSGIKYEIIKKQIILIRDNSISTKVMEPLPENLPPPQKKQLKGKVTDSKGNPIPGTTVIVKGTTTGSITNIDGDFVLDVPYDSKALTFSFVGYKSLDVPIGNKMTFAVMLEEMTVGIEEVVAVGYGLQKKTTVTGAISKIEGKQILKSPTANITNSLMGKVSGVTSIMRNGQPGYQNADIFIRGQATWADASAIIVVDGVERSDFGNIDPNEIESLNVLKDASSTAIFGVRGANGVILITTKTGKVSPAKVTYTGNVSANVFNDFAHIMNPYDGAVYTNEGLVAAGKSPMFTDAQLQKFKDGSDPIGYPDVDWTKYLMRKSTMQTQHNINVQGGTENVKYYVSMGYMYANGVFKNFPSPYGIKTNNDDSRYNFRSNLDFNLGKDLQIGLKLGGRFEKIYQPYSQTSAVLMAIISSIPRYAFPAYLSEGKLAMITGASPFNANPLAMITRQGYTQTQKNTVESSINLNYKMNWLTDGLGFRSLLTFDNDLNGTRAQGGAFALYDFERESKLYKFPSGNFYDSPLGNVSTASTGNMNYNLQVGFDYFREFGKHNVTGLLLGTRKLSQLTGAEPPNAIQGLAVRITYNFNNKYLAEFSSAYNGSENFPKGQRYGFFPALTAGWIISNENFFQNQKVISFFKLKGSYGYSGNDRIGGSRFLFLNDYSTKTTTTAPVSSYSTPGDQVLFGDPNSLVKYPVVVHSRIGYPNVTWEKSLKRNIGFESSFFNRMLSINVDFFDEKRTNILLPRQSGLLTYGEAFPNVNFGETSNKGYEFELTFTKKVGEFTLGFYSQVSYARNKIISKDEPAGIPDYLKQEGKPIGQIFGYKTAGFFNSQEEINNWAVNKLGITYVGGIKFVDVNKDGVINSLDKCPIMNSLIPEYTFSFEPRVEWNGISFSATFQGVAKCSSDIIMNWSGYEFMNERWTTERYASGQKITWPSPANGWAVTNNDLILSNNEYIKLRNAELAWQLPKNIVEKMHLAGMRIFLTGQNLFTWTNFKYYIDPEVTLKSDYVKAYAYPTSRTYNLGVTVQF